MPRTPAPRRKSAGAWYTPPAVARALLAFTLDAWAEGLEGPEAQARALAEARVLDPACGDGALLEAAAEVLLAAQAALAERLGRAFDPDEARAALLPRLHGVDLDPGALARVALPGARLACGDALLTPEELPGGLDWSVAFPDVDGFDLIVANPPYVKLQTLKRGRPAAAAALLSCGRYESVRTGNFDLYLPFVERSLGLLRAGGRLGVVGPSLWWSSRYGQGLRRLVRRRRALARMLDFQDAQLFAEASTYTAFQVFAAAPVAEPRGLRAPEGLGGLARWEAQSYTLPWSSLPEQGAWSSLPPGERAWLERLREGGAPLGELASIAVGVQTSADAVYHLERVGPGRYQPKGGGEPVALEAELLRPLLSGAAVRRYHIDHQRLYLLFPYAVEGGQASLLSAEVLAERSPLAWAYLRQHEASLRAREGGKMDRDEGWWGYNYPKNLALQHLPKLVVAQTAPRLRVAFDEVGAFALNNVRVNGIFPRDAEEAWFLLGVLNGAAADRALRLTAKPKAGGYFEANKQYIAPLPVPRASAAEVAEVARLARELAGLHRARAMGADVELEAVEAALEGVLGRLYGGGR